MNRHTSLTIGLPVCNGEAFLAEALDSLLAQTHGDFRIIISDNASTDSTEEIAREYQSRDERIRYDRLTENVGAIANFNRVAQLCETRYFKWAAADDICEPTYLEKCLRVLQRSSEVVWCHSQSGKIDPAGRILSQGDVLCDDWSHTTHAGLPRADCRSRWPHRRYRGVLLGTSWCADSYGIIRAEALRKTKLLCACFGSEKVLMGALSLQGWYEEVPETLFYQRIHGRAAGRLDSAAAQEQFVERAGPRCFRGTRARLLKGHCEAVLHAPMSIADRLLCFGVIAQYLLQVSKWSQVLADSIQGRGLRRVPRRKALDLHGPIGLRKTRNE